MAKKNENLIQAVERLYKIPSTFSGGGCGGRGSLSAQDAAVFMLAVTQVKAFPSMHAREPWARCGTRNCGTNTIIRTNVRRRVFIPNNHPNKTEFIKNELTE